jgi:hypothetical protein
MPTREPTTDITTHKLPDGWSLKRVPQGRSLIHFAIYKDGYIWRDSNVLRPYHTVELWLPDTDGLGLHGEPRISLASASDKSIELATCISAALAEAIAEAQAILEQDAERE